jgi:hypothetical protein
MAILDSLWVRLGFQVDAKNLEKFEGLAQKAKSTMLGLGAAISGAAIGLGLMVDKTAEKMDAVGDFADIMGMTAREVDAFNKVAKENDSSAEAMQGTISSLTALTGQAAAGFKRATMVFQKFGLHAKNADGSTKSFDQILADVIEKLQTLDTGKQLALASRLGIDKSLLPLLRQGVTNFEQLRDAALNANPFTAEQYALADKTTKQYAKARSAIDLLTKRISVALMPTVNRILESFVKWTKKDENVRRLTAAIEAAGKVLEYLWKNLGKVVALIGVLMTYKLGVYVGDLATKIASAAKSMGSLSAAGGLLKSLLTGGLIGLILLIAEDLWVFYQGGESVTGLLLKKFPYAVQVMQGALVAAIAALGALMTGSGPFGLLLLGIGGFIIAANAIREAWNPLKQWWQDLWDGMFNTVANFWNAIPKPIRAMMIGAIPASEGVGAGDMSMDVLKKAENSRLKLAQFSGGEGGFQPWTPGGTEGPEPAWMRKGGTAGAQTTTNITGVNINLPNATNPQESAREVARTLTRLAHGGVGG